MGNGIAVMLETDPKFRSTKCKTWDKKTKSVATAVNKKVKF